MSAPGARATVNQYDLKLFLAITGECIQLTGAEHQQLIKSHLFGYVLIILTGHLLLRAYLLRRNTG